MKEFSSKDRNQVSGEIESGKPKPEGLGHLEKKEGSREASPEEKRAARVTKYRELLSKQEAMLEELNPSAIKEKARQAYERALNEGQDGDMAGRLKEAMRKNLEERAADIGNLIEDIKGNISKLEAGQDNPYEEN